MKEEDKTIKYKGKCIKMHEDTWQLLMQEREKSNLSWNLFLLKLLGKEDVYAKTTKTDKKRTRTTIPTFKRNKERKLINT